MSFPKMNRKPSGKQSNIMKVKKFLQSKKFLVVLGFLGLYLFSAGTSWAIFSFVGGDSDVPSTVSKGELEDARSKINLDLPRTEECALNGGMFTKIEENIWKDRRPITVVIENHLDSRPQSGLSRADVVYEAVAEGGITRFLAVYLCGASIDDVRIGPVRSVRVYFVDWAAEYGDNPLFVHVGGANRICNNCPGGLKPRGQVDPKADAFSLLINLGWRAGTVGNDMDGGTNVGFPVMLRDYERIPGAATEHTFMGFTDKLYTEGASRGFGVKDDEGNRWDDNFVSWKFKDDEASSSPDASEISFEFWSNKGDYEVTWKYDSEGNKYLRFHGNDKHIDMDTEEQLSAKNVVVQFVKEQGPVDSEGHMLYTTTGEGEALIFQDGGVIEGTWEKDARTDRTKFFDEDGKEIKFVRGVIWIEAVPAGNDIDY